MAERAPRVVVGFHGSAGSHDALHLGRLLARTLDVDLEVAVALPYEPLPLPVEAYDDALEEHFEGLFNAARRDLGEYPFTLSGCWTPARVQPVRGSCVSAPRRER